jgi:hypothetical protein
LPDEVVTSTWNKYPAKTFEITNNGVVEKIMTLYPDGYRKSKTVIKIFGTKDNFDELINSFIEFKINK